MLRLVLEADLIHILPIFPTLPSSPSLDAIVKARHAARAAGSAFLFERSPGQPVKDFREAWRLACERAGVPGRVPHDLRRSRARARALTRAHVPQSVAMRLLGHKTASMFLRYDVAATEDLVEAVAAAERPPSRVRGAPELATRADPDDGTIE